MCTEMLDQNRAPIFEALQKFKEMRIVPFDVPGHKRGRGNEELTRFLGKQCMDIDVNSMKPLDNLCHPVSVIKEAEEIAAEAFGAAHAFFMVGGTTSAVQSMIMYACKSGEKIIMPRNVHRSAINALILTGAVPVYVNPDVNSQLGIALGMSPDQVEKAIEENPDAKAVLVNNPTYYGICSDLRRITELAHAKGMKVLVDEAHGTHFYFGSNFPVTAMAAGADIASVSMHKSGGSLTQSSFLLMGSNINADYMRQIINLTQTTSASYLLLSSLDISRKRLALNGREIFAKTVEYAEYARKEINGIGGYYAYSRELINGGSVYDFDISKLSVNTLPVGLAGIEVYDLLRDEYDIQIEFGDIGNILAYLSVGDRRQDVERLISALSEIKRRFGKTGTGMLTQEYINPIVADTPRKAFYADKVSLPLEETAGHICTEFVMCYPPGIPILAPGELITEDIISYIRYAKEKGCSMTGTEDINIERLNVERSND
ncbi:MAG: aminotransferase class I/II-fold pyridoxal phosphate-dependent enzyme [Oscillospiraceae bacterium]|nr:aminotransferase class I/II-fold pyridoxal phosphate-dependent enzyme [Ruminococcus sp.]MDD6097643.1 aminotransferase class I/II-fold pyridoxal phosphate-dependent enzyme [Oscillospiraceae bacterium]